MASARCLEFCQDGCFKTSWYTERKRNENMGEADNMEWITRGTRWIGKPVVVLPYWAVEQSCSQSPFQKEL